MREAMAETNLPIATLRYWETRFPDLNPRKDGHGNRYYTRENLELIKRIKYIRDELKITRIEAIQNELNKKDSKVDMRQQVAEILSHIKNELTEIRASI